jgi:ATP-binding cassette subfamily B protein
VAEDRAVAAHSRSDADILVLDEPTAAMTRPPKPKCSNISARLGKRDAVVISHRFSTVRHGRSHRGPRTGHIIERGNHETLMQQDGIYAKLFALQAR